MLITGTNVVGIFPKATPHNSGKQSKNHRWQQKVQRI